MTMTVNTFVKNLETIKKINSTETLADMIGFAFDKVACKRPNFTPLDALVSVYIQAGQRAKIGKIFRALGATSMVKLTMRDEPDEWRGLTVDYQIRPKKEKFESFIGLATIAKKPDRIIEALTALALEDEQAKEQKKKEKEQAKQTAQYWKERLEKLINEAGKHGFEIQGSVKKLTAEKAA